MPMAVQQPVSEASTYPPVQTNDVPSNPYTATVQPY